MKVECGEKKLNYCVYFFIRLGYVFYRGIIMMLEIDWFFF